MPEDYIVTAAMVTSTSNLGKFSIDGEDLKQGGLESPSLAAMLKLVLAQTILYHLASNLVKASFLVQYLRLFLVIPQIVWICNVLLILVFGATAWGIFGNIFLCEPVQSYWNVTLSGKCMNKENHFWSTSIIGLVLDFSIWVLPIPVIGKLNLPSRQKLGLVAVFGLEAGTYAIIFSTIEVNVAIICGSLLVMKPLIARFLPGIMSEQPMTAADDERTCRTLTGLHLLSGGTEGDVEKAQRGGRRDTLIESDAFATTKEMKRLMKGLGNSKRNTM
ncbi:uncharacterized protein J4E87_000224 [Alternaria ethzedia]|uniref:uncharacterized protein n=1 Tax=Alternaria ethzedia TaxID=181014 RepID=UPI0020C425E3|nr:uncharacterized protein J4E87_000224 [Alternaria ethzedia]KAI4635274.1 hypothetical protein J4E87_000224 [Alternaria ethzedia]